MNYYQIRYTGLSDIKLHSDSWEQAERLKIGHYPWNPNPERILPETDVRLLYSSTGIHIRFDVEEANIVATYTKPNDPVCRDSCVEFFFTPNLTDPYYLSFEVNPLGTMLIGFGTGGHDIRYLDTDRQLFEIEAEKAERCWKVKYWIPFDFLDQYFQKIDRHFKGNFMKCADRSATPHHGCWNPIRTEIPRFHVPQFFGRLECCRGECDGQIFENCRDRR